MSGAATLLPVMADTWNIRGRAEACSRCERPFEPGAVCHSELVRGEQRFERRDLCDACRNQPCEGAPAVSRWRILVEPPPAPAPEPIQRRSAESLLRRLAEDPSREAANTRFILALMLERKRVIRCRDSFRNDNRAQVFVYEHPQTGETVLVPDPGLNPEQASEVRAQLAVFLHEETPAADDNPPADNARDAADRRDTAADAPPGSPAAGPEENVDVTS